MFSNKEGVVDKALVEFLIAVVVIIVLGLVLVGFKNIGKDVSNRETCRASVLANEKRLEVAGTELTPGLTDLKCPTQKITVKDPEKIKLILANQMYDCWDKFGRGKIKFLDPEIGTYCIICSKINFEDEAKGKELGGFLGYLAETKIRDDRGNPVPGIDYTYIRFLTDYETKQDELEKIKAVQDDIINTNNDYAVMFLYYKQQLLGKPENAALGGVTGCVLGGLVGVGAIIFSGGSLMPVLAPIYASTCAGGIVAGGSIGWLLGNDPGAEWAARVVTVPYQDIDKLGCTSLE
ncbi:hypothetical protein HYX18_03310 [Candidatus Woesearchaeota archaeon]|nr:hypothetical protein [Candidatus Woesearchaeota archaeon]